MTSDIVIAKALFPSQVPQPTSGNLTNYSHTANPLSWILGCLPPLFLANVSVEPGQGAHTTSIPVF